MKIVRLNKFGQIIDTCNDFVYGTHYKMVGNRIIILSSPFSYPLDLEDRLEIRE